MTFQQLDFATYLKNLTSYQPDPALIKPIVRTSSSPRLPVTKPILKPVDYTSIIAQLRKAADGLQSQIDYKLNPAIANQRVTARRARIADGMAQEGRWLQRIQAKLYALASGFEAGIVPDELKGIRYRAQVEILLGYNTYPNYQDTREKLGKAGITEQNYHQVKVLFDALQDSPQDDPAIVKIKKLERELLTYKIPGFFPTPKAIAEKMVSLARIEPGQTILEPSACKGNIAEVICAQYPDNSLSVIEWQSRLQEILTLKGFTVIGTDFLDCAKQFDCIIMNPPFEKFQDIDHVKHAYNLLTPGGRLVSIMGESTFFRTDTKVIEFRDWLSYVGYDEKLPANSFQESGTGVAARIVIIDKGH